ncbi:2-iminobutanoate/2-iminopropanoate deaminase [Fontibacillus solani]|uniref:2-iminobutanoate/2-iminopropanoate deaminase n=1 Tax=Fontibacillus solani TaxID=1572857 RepID=A0A7W3SQF0_9BACL|nr:RidA family protein [Fontibacillus solani]MBA9084331.1 2-iminobutanoate/2-iminopropanoate deaminase [Fontibacillus solani]
MSKKIINSTKAPGAIGPYSQAVMKGNFLYVSGQLPVNAETGFMPENIQKQTKQSLQNVVAILEEAGSSLNDVLKTTVFLKNMEHFTEFNEVYKQFFAQDFPARSCVEVARLPKDALVEIEVVAILG